ncbi:Alginate lyase [Flavobacterium gilvum]|nr:Alginate lyase [Flavobacterium gilvum]
MLALFTSASFTIYAQKAPKIDLSLWKLTIPEGAATTYKGQPLLDYSENLDIQKFMYNDSDDRSLVFYVSQAVRAKKATAKTELKEQNSFGGDAGWTFKQGATLKTSLKMVEVSKKDANYSRIIFAQIGGRLKEEQANLIGAKDKNAPAILKVYWDNGFIKLRSKRIANPSITGNDLLKEESWIDDDGYTFKKQVGFDKFTLQIVIKDGKMEVSVDGEKKVYAGDNYDKWGGFNNYFNVGCNPQGDEQGTYGKVKFYTIEVSH